MHYTSRKVIGDERPVFINGAALKVIASKHPRYGYGRARVLLRRAGEAVNHKRVARVWREGGLSLPRRKRLRRRYHKAQRSDDRASDTSERSLDV